MGPKIDLRAKTNVGMKASCFPQVTHRYELYKSSSHITHSKARALGVDIYVSVEV